MTVHLQRRALPGTALMTTLLLALGLAACGGSSGSSLKQPPPPPPAVTVVLTPGSAQTIDQGQTVSLTATVSNDSSNKGVTWSVSGGGALSNQTATSATYTAPATVSSATTATVTATSAASTTVSASLSIKVNPDPAVTTTSVPNATLGTAYSANLAATGGTGTLTWALASGTLPAGLTLNATGVLSGTPTAAGKSTFSVVATDAVKGASPPAALSLTVNSNAPAPLTITTTTLTAAVEGTTYSATLAATGGTAPYTWSLATGSSLPAGLALSSAGVISGQPTASGSFNFTVQVADSAATPATATQALALTVSAAGTGSNDAEFKGQYAFLAADPTATAQAAMVASITADGKGSISGGEYDLNSLPVTTGKTTITGGTYTLGSDGRGTLTFTNTLGNTYTFAVALGSVSSGIAQSGALIETDGQMMLTGTLALQDAAAFTQAALSGPFAFGISGGDATYAAAGSFSLAATGAISSGLMDSNDKGTVSAAQAFSGSISTIDASGRGTLTLAGGGAAPFYVVSANKMLLASNVPNGTAAIEGTVERQSGGPYSAASLSGNVILVTSSATGVPSGHALVGLLTLDGVSSATASTTDTNDGGSISLDQPLPGTLTYTVTAAANGRVTLGASGVQKQAVYLISPNNGFALNIGGGPELSHVYGQSAGPFSAASVKGSFTWATLPPAAAPIAPPSGIPAYGVASGELTADGAGKITGTLDAVVSGTPGSSSANFTDTYAVAGNGRITTGSGNYILYIISPTHVIGLLVLANDPNPVIIDLRQ